MTAAQILALLITIMPASADAEGLSVAIAHATRTRHEAAVLVSLDRNECYWGLTSPHRFGVIAFGADAPLEHVADRAIAIWRAGGADDFHRFFAYHSGRPISRVRGHSRAFRRAGRSAFAYSRLMTRVVERFERQLVQLAVRDSVDND